MSDDILLSIEHLKKAYGDNVVDVDNDKWTGVCEELITWYQENIIPMIG